MSAQIEKIGHYNGKHAKRPEWLVPGIVLPNLIARLTELAPKELKMIGSSSK